MSSTEPRRIQLSRQKGWRMPSNTVKVDRTTKWGNPWRVGDLDIPDATEAVRMFRRAVCGTELNGIQHPPVAHPESRIGKIISDIEELRGKNLACWCPLDGPCHADVLLELANAG